MANNRKRNSKTKGSTYVRIEGDSVLTDLAPLTDLAQLNLQVQGVGPRGATGARGASGNNGADGVDGVDGVDGARGLQGLQGIAGNNGVAGGQGAQGPQGIPGAIGVTGNDGADGLPGNQGSQGAPGINGIDGAPGIQGNPGTQGASGADGADGADGLPGPIGATGVAGPVGIAGSAGADGADGAQGLQGLQGAIGANGADGAQGLQGVTGNDGIDGAQGPQGDAGLQGIAGSDGVNGAPGLKGADGIDGSQGPQGIAGVAPTITINALGEWEIAGVSTGIVAGSPDPYGDLGLTDKNGVNPSIPDVAIMPPVSQVQNPEIFIDADKDGTYSDHDSDDSDSSVGGFPDADGDGMKDSDDAFPNDSSEDTDQDGDGVGGNADFNDQDANEQTDSDGDGVGDNSDAFPNDGTEQEDSDGDGVGDNSDALPFDSSEQTDSDGDGVGDNSDAFPNDGTEQEDSDGDGVGDNSDALPFDSSDSVDSDGDGVGDSQDSDDDNDGVDDINDSFPFDGSESVDTDNDGIGNNADTDDDGDGVPDGADAFPLDFSESVDTDGDGVGNNTDTDDDNDGINDGDDSSPLDSTTSGVDADNDSIDDAVDPYPSVNTNFADVDGDGVWDSVDFDVTGNDTSKSSAFTGFGVNDLTIDPEVSGVWSARDYYSHIYENQGTFDLGRGWNAGEELNYRVSIPGLPNYFLTNFEYSLATTDDGQSAGLFVVVFAGGLRLHVRNGTKVGYRKIYDSATQQFVNGFSLENYGFLGGDLAGQGYISTFNLRYEVAKVKDSDGDGVSDFNDAFPYDATESVDTDGDGVGDNADLDDDGDGTPDVSDFLPKDATESADSDGDGVGDNADDLPFNANEQTDSDGDGVGDNSDLFPNDGTKSANLSLNDQVGPIPFGTTGEWDGSPQTLRGFATNSELWIHGTEWSRGYYRNFTDGKNIWFGINNVGNKLVAYTGTNDVFSDAEAIEVGTWDNDGLHITMDGFIVDRVDDTSITIHFVGVDTDNDGVADTVDAFPNDPSKSVMPAGPIQGGITSNGTTQQGQGTSAMYEVFDASSSEEFTFSWNAEPGAVGYRVRVNAYEYLHTGNNWNNFVSLGTEVYNVTALTFNLPKTGGGQSAIIRVASVDAAGNVSPEVLVYTAVVDNTPVDADGDGIPFGVDSDDNNASITGIDVDSDGVDDAVDPDDTVPTVLLNGNRIMETVWVTPNSGAGQTVFNALSYVQNPQALATLSFMQPRIRVANTAEFEVVGDNIVLKVNPDGYAPPGIVAQYNTQIQYFTNSGLNNWAYLYVKVS